MSHLIFLTNIGVYISGMCFGKFGFVKSKKRPVDFVLVSNMGSGRGGSAIGTEKAGWLGALGCCWS